MNEFVIDFAPIMEALVSLLTAVLLALACLCINWVRGKLGLDRMAKDDAVRGYLDASIRSAVKYTASKVMDGQTTISTRNEFVSIGAQYVLDAVPDAIGHFGLSQARISRLVEARISDELPQGVTGLLAKAKEVKANEPDT